MSDLILALLILVPLILLTVTVILIVNGSRKLRRCAECTGIITELKKVQTPMQKPGERNVSPVVSYMVNGKTYAFIGNYWSTSMRVGQKINVLYEREDPSKATIKQGLYVAPMITGGLGLFFTIGCILFALLKSGGLIHF